ncbi:DUF6520 family protein [Confluentibacter sediminis]|uniref:DUF6520 family protein n=1 Tax=Confluentibacter sediminis TaxID=2219045 RepID=UPI000DACB6F5|nr:DUF6520 family protein [Confluentibacter sediminis]
MKKNQSFLMIVAFVLAIGGAFAFNQNALTDSFRSDGCNPETKPAICTSTEVNDPVCTIEGLTYYQNDTCSLEWRIPQ